METLEDRSVICALLPLPHPMTLSMAVENVATGTSRSSLWMIAREAGNIETLELYEPQGMAFCTYETVADAHRAMRLLNYRSVHSFGSHTGLCCVCRVLMHSQYKGKSLRLRLTDPDVIYWPPPPPAKRARSDENLTEDLPITKKARVVPDYLSETWYFISATERPGHFVVHQWQPPSRETAEAIQAVWTYGMAVALHMGNTVDPTLYIGRAMNWLLGDDHSTDKPLEFHGLTRADFGTFQVICNGVLLGDWAFGAGRTFVYSSWCDGVKD